MTTNPNEQAASFLAGIVLGIVRNPHRVEVRATQGPHGLTYLDVITPDDQRGILIGRQGRMFDVLCHILRAYSAVQGRRYVPRIVDNFTRTEDFRNAAELQGIRT